ncbi:hypothetical protein EW093_12450 [Thiospirochaeta perfilievii]|uniref:DoxX family protein n=1 Tax=Thiospirochaeta perfilievii TaxID=252967 RepID=A0A5C1QEJ7_9SPIO|nr:hypothetical protein [Thiospirochaeta perfilievii]QEN05490.1 hypothetical protein EW093_12450 [Thiospirochaeta perfilievii]
MKKNGYLSGQFLIQLAIGLYFALSGLLGIMGYNQGVNQLFNGINKLTGTTNYLPLIISILFALAGSGMILGLFLSIKNSFIYFVVFVLWIVYIIMNFFTDNFIKPNLLIWLKDLSLQLIILAGLWNTTQRIK